MPLEPNFPATYQRDPQVDPPDPRPWILAATILGSSLAMIDNSVVNVALPVLQVKLQASAVQMQWVVEAYALFLSALILVGGSLGDHFGRRRVFAIGIGLFTLASVGCGLAPQVETLIAARALQGIGGALLVPGSLAIITASFSSEQRGQAIGTWSGATAITSALGPVLGGWLVENTSWRWIFLINLPMALVVLAILFWRVPESRDEQAAKTLDIWGAMLATVGLGGWVYGLLESGSRGLTDPLVVLALCLGTVAAVGFGVVEWRSPDPMMPLTLFRSATFSGANGLTLLLYGALGAVLFYFPFNLVQLQNYAPTAAGAALLPIILLLFFLSRWAGDLTRRYGSRRPLILGPVIAGVGFGLLAVPGIGGSYWTTYFPGILVLGMGLVITVAPLTTTVMAAVATHQAGIASGINNAVARGSGLITIALMSLVVTTSFNQGLDQRLASLQIPPNLQLVIDAERIKLAAAKIPAGLEVTAALQQAIAASFLDSFRLVMFLAAGMAVASGVIAAIWIRDPEGSEPASELSMPG